MISPEGGSRVESTLTLKEVSRAQVMQQLKTRQITQHQAAEQLGLSVRQVKRLWQAYQRGGARALISKQRAQSGHHRLSPILKELACDLIRTQYADFGPTLACEKLEERHQLVLSHETVRQLMIEAGLWHPRHAPSKRIHPLRERRARRGELVQMDGSAFDWFEGRRPKCTLLVLIDDATGQLLHLHFTPAESTFSYFEALERYLRHWGKPLALYCDKLSVFRVNLPRLSRGDALTQFTRAMGELDIELICANTPQAKGRVEKAHQTLQDRLTKELRLRGLSTLEQAQAFLPEFIDDFNRRFAVPARDLQDAHRPLLPQDQLERHLTVQEERTLSKNLTLQYRNVIYQITTKRPGYALRKAKVLVRENREGEITIEYKDHPLAYTVYHRQMRLAEVVPSKELNAVVDQKVRKEKRRRSSIPAPDHPWRKFKIHPDRKGLPSAR